MDVLPNGQTKAAKKLLLEGHLRQSCERREESVRCQGVQVSWVRRSLLLGLEHASELMSTEVTCKTGLGRGQDS